MAERSHLLLLLERRLGQSYHLESGSVCELGQGLICQGGGGGGEMMGGGRDSYARGGGGGDDGWGQGFICQRGGGGGGGWR